MDILKIVKESGITQKSIAKELGTSPSQFGDVLHGRRPFPIKWVRPLCMILQCDPNFLFEWEKETMGQ